MTRLYMIECEYYYVADDCCYIDYGYIDQSGVYHLVSCFMVV